MDSTIHNFWLRGLRRLLGPGGNVAGVLVVDEIDGKGGLQAGSRLGKWRGTDKVSSSARRRHGG
jgi:hypothetical protein